MKSVRQNVILEIISTQEIETQNQLMQALNERGISSTQATLSRDIKELRGSSSVYRELILVKVKANASERQAVSAIADIFRASIVDVGKESMTIMLTGDQSKLNALISLVEDYEILELARTGVTGLSSGMEDVRYLP